MVFAAMANAERIKHMAIAKHALQSNKCKKKIDFKIFFQLQSRALWPVQNLFQGMSPVRETIKLIIWQ